MGEEGVERKLTTILAADVVGYSRLMGEDEVQTLAALKADRKELIDPKTAKRAVTHQLDGAPTIWRPPPKGVRPWRTHASLDGDTPAERSGSVVTHPAALHNFIWEKHCGGLFELPVAA